jgi:hypothetical protein
MIRSALAIAVVTIAAVLVPATVQAAPQAGSKSPPKATKTPCPLPVSQGEPRAGAGGQLEIDGAGRVQARGSFLAFGGVTGMSVTITNRSGKGRVCVGGKSVAFPRRATGSPPARTITLRPGALRALLIEGRDMTARFTGQGNVYLSITGRGSVKLDGVGTFRMNGREAESWPMKPLTLPLRSPRAQNRR